MLEERNSLKLKQLEKYFVPAGIDAKLILQAFKIQQHRKMLSSSRTKPYAIDQKLQEEVSKIDFLRVTGRQSNIPQIIRRSPNKKANKDLKLLLDDRIEQIINVVAQDPDRRYYKNQLTELQHLSSQTSPKSSFKLDKKGIFSQKQLEGTSVSNPRSQLKDLGDSSKSNDLDYYQQMILNNPVLYRKIMLAYNASKRQLQKEQNELKKVSNRRETVYEIKMHTRPIHLESFKNSNDQKKGSYFNKFREFQLVVSLTNKMLIYPQQDLQYKAYICKGNNGLLMKSILKTRPWWSIRGYNQIQSCNLIWTEWKKSKIINKLPNKERKYGLPYTKETDIHSGLRKRQIALLATKKANNFQKIVGSSDQIWEHYERIPQFDSYLKFTTKVGDPKFIETARIVFQKNEYSHQQVQKESKAHNHLPGCLQLHSKKLLFLNMKQYYQRQGKDIFTVIPLTFHITRGSQDPQFLKFSEYYQKAAQSKTQDHKQKNHNIWICKPGQNSNRGNGISVLNNFNEIKSLVDQKCTSNRSIIIQKYFQNPFLYNKRKFDIRCYMLITTINGIIKGYWYQEGYIRTSSKEFSLKNLDNKFIHLTNDAIQKKGEEYGKFQNYNKVSYPDFEKYLEQLQSEQVYDFQQVVKKMKSIAIDLIEATSIKLNPRRKEYCFELFGLDYMLDDKLNPYLIEANSNPCIQVDGSVLGKVIPSLLENVVRVAIDPIFPPPYSQNLKNRYSVNYNPYESNKMVLVFDSYIKDNSYEKPYKQLERQQNEVIEDKQDLQQMDLQ